MGIGIGVVLMCILNVGKEADKHMEEIKENKESAVSYTHLDVYKRQAS